VPRVLFGRGAISRAGAEAEAFGQRALFVCTPSLTRSTHAQRVRESLGSRLVAEFNDVAPHVPREAVDAARTLAAEKRVDVIVAMGGGSAIGVGKGVALQGSALIAIPTTYAGSEVTAVVGITDRREGRKRVQRDPAALPRLAIYDPEVTIELSPELTASTAMNALAHCVEAVYAREVNPIVPPVALEGIRRIMRSLPQCVANGGDLDAREDLLSGAYLAAFGIANATMGLHHAICHVLGGRTGVAHGVLNAVVLPHVMQFNADAVPDAMTAIADAMQAGARTRDLGAAARATAALLESMPLSKRLRDAGVQEEILEPAAGEIAAGDTVKANPKPVGRTEVLEILRAAW
jgi:maleylacetate reductase